MTQAILVTSKTKICNVCEHGTPGLGLSDVKDTGGAARRAAPVSLISREHLCFCLKNFLVSSGHMSFFALTPSKNCTLH